jgi:chemotaxis protein histidine kinase CheA
MADFVAVIRRAVDGLSDNTPEMRVKVYARARGAVQRQLESMKPRPPETMLQRQMEKLEAAIRDVEAEHAEAAVAEPVSDLAVAVAEPYQAPVEDYQPPEPDAVHQQPAAAPTADEPAPVYAVEEAAAVAAPSPLDAWREQDDWQPEASPAAVETPAPAYHAHEAEPFVEPPEPVAAAPVHAEWQHAPQTDLASSIDEVHRQLTETAPEAAAEVVGEHFITETHSDPVHADNAAHFDDVWAESAAPDINALGEPNLAWSAQVVPEHSAPTAIPVHYPPDIGFTADHQTSARMPEAVEPFSWDAATFDDLPPVTPKATAPARTILPTPAGDYDDVDLFSDVHGIPAKPAIKAAPVDGWNELKELSGYEKFAAETDFGTVVPTDLSQVSVAGLQGKSYRMQPKRSRFGVVGILLTLIGVAIVGGAGYAAWLNRVSLNAMVTGLVSSATKNAAVADKASTPAAQTAATSPATAPAATKPTTAAAQSSSPANTNVAALDNDGNTVNSKFTQRLMADGSEVDAGAPPVPGGPVTAEGKSIAQQNVAATTPPPAAAAATAPAPAVAAPAAATSAPVADATPAPAAAVAAPAAVPAATATVPSATPPAATQTATVGTPEKMFLYEERLGQTSPTAIEGSVTWTVQEDKGDDGKPSPTIQGSINVPERGMTALITFKRNTDPSLPASHLIEIVFSLPPNFEGGAIDSVQRVAMKATEQDRGDPLIAVPAKITDDFHMVALNDFPDARKTNLDLLRSRNWIDIPVTYRNGRRALLTMDKGQTGTDAFNKVIGEWAAIGGTSSSQ